MKLLKINTRLIVILGYCVLVSLAIYGFLAIYMEMSKSSKIPQVVPKQELIGLNNTLTTMYQAEGTVGLLSIITDKELNLEYDSLMNCVFEEIKFLKDISKDTDMLANLDSLSCLLMKKQANALQMVALMDNLEKNTIKEITQITISDRRDVDKLNSLLINEIQNTQDTTIIIGKEKKGFFKRIKEAIKPNSQDTIRQITNSSASNVRELTAPIVSDTIIKSMKDSDLSIEKKNANIIRQLVRRQNELHLMNELTGIQIRQIMNVINKLEYQNNLDVLSERNELLNRSTSFVAAIGLAALIIAILFMSWTLSSVNRGIRLQNSIREEKKRVDKLLVSREQLIYTITHDIKAPIGSIMGFLDLLSEDEPTPKQQYYVDNMNSSAHHILDLVKNLLDFQSLEKNRQQLSLMPFLLYSFIKDTYESFLPVAEKNKLKINLETNIQANNKYLSDPYRIRQILNNLISNAIKFTPENGTILISAATDKQNRLRVSVKDTGPGIDDTDKSIIFEEFTRLEDTRESVEGTGLGLTISKKLAILLGGNIELESVKGEGSDFILTIPITPFIEESSSSSKNTDSKGTLQEKIRVLFVDDDVTQLNFVSELMKKAGLTYTCCSKATEALQLLQEESFNIIFTDIQMPEIKGFDLVKKIRESTFADSATIPVIGLSADNKWHEQYKEAGFTGFVLKPFKTKQLLDVIKKYSSKTQTNIKYSGRFEFNFDSLMQFISDDREVALKMIDSFIEETDKNLKLLKTAFQKDDWDTIKELSHKMSSLMKMVSANKIVSILILFEKGSQSKEKEVTLCRLIEKIIKEAKEAKWKVQLKS